MFISFRIQALQAGTALVLFMIYAALLGVLLKLGLRRLHPHLDHPGVLISAASFGALSLYATRPSATCRRLGPS